MFKRLCSLGRMTRAYGFCGSFLSMFNMSGLQVEAGFIKTEHANVWYKKYYTEQSRNKAPVVCVHGGPAMQHGYIASLQELAMQNPVVFYDQSGCGKSTMHDPAFNNWGLEHYAQELREVIDALGFDKIDLLGHSWGGTLALNYAAQYPDRVVKLILASPLFYTEQWVADTQAYVQELPPKMRAVIAECESNGNTDCAEYQEVVMAFYKKHLCRVDPLPQRLVDALAALNMSIYLKMWGSSEFTVTGNLLTLDLRDQLPKLSMPVLVTCGRCDTAAPATMQRLVEQVPHAQLVIFEKSSHMPHLEEPSEYIKVIEQFIQEQ